MVAKSIGLAAASVFLFFNAAALASPKPVIEELFKSNQTLGGRSVVYPEGTPEMRVYKVTLAPGSTIPLHTHPSPVVAFVQEGALHNIRLVDGAEVVDLIVAGQGFLEGSPDEPHYVVNKGSIPAVLMVTFASVEGLPNLVKIN
ncbi:cupin domain-containing protein [Synechococcus sp. A15-127]|uniref:cupin domain-containing protein n=1 Tax=Synechococcus sp. A15-127 TaxID=1050624 RepID=UPI001644C2FF|nr:cupin domain-containing protein [Synechococcus sp. A15-127]QNI94564.1 cupin domain-containing protein [Synechococcus sp. A15-127]